MCGIFAHVGGRHCTCPADILPPHSIAVPLAQRGPDYQGKCFSAPTSRSPRLVFHGSVLALRGPSLVPQPLRRGPLTLLWNGEAWSIAARALAPRENDAIAVLDHFERALADASTTDSAQREAAPAAAACITGPFAFVLHDAKNARLWYGRDGIGRRSLLTRHVGECFELSSVGDGTAGWVEVEPGHVRALDLADDAAGTVLGQSLQASPANPLVASTTSSLRKELAFNWSMPDVDEAVSNVEGSTTASISASRPVGFKEEQLHADESPSLRMTRKAPLLEVESTAVEALCEDLYKSVSERLAGLCQLPNNTAAGIVSVQAPTGQPKAARVAVLFSGGLDCTVLAQIIHDLSPPAGTIDLLNVAFFNPRVHNKPLEPRQTAEDEHSPREQERPSAYDRCPDRITARSSLRELRSRCPDRTWQLVEIDVPYEEFLSHRDTVMKLIHPHNTEMDLSIAIALYFAARGIGHVFDGVSQHKRPYETPAKVLFSGLGADELFGGYQRHATAYGRLGFSGLLSELHLDISRLGKRNLGRDDRVISNWGREARYPYLAEALVARAVAAPVWEKCGFGQDVNYKRDHEEAQALEPGKLVLRLLARKLGLKGVAAEKKRAIQFGARTAKMLDGKSKGTHIIS